jgi:hypothetical protein
MTEEQWRPVVGYEGLYEVSDQGRVRTTRRKGSAGGLRKLHTNKATGYVALGLCREGQMATKTVHNLVMEAFIGPCPEGQEIRHLDGNPANPQLDNLAYGTSYENKLDTIRHGTHRPSSQTHCKRGHSLERANIYVQIKKGRPSRVCKTCVSERRKAARRTPA